MEVIVPAAGLSSRFPGMKPKYLMFDYQGKMMVDNAIRKYLEKGYNVTIGILKEHDQKYNSRLFLEKELPGISIVVLENPTKGPADTVRQIIESKYINFDKPLFIKDCDSFFDHIDEEGSYICVSDIRDHDILKKLSSKSFVIYNDQKIITDIIEKQVLSDKFCVGGYKFNKISDFMDSCQLIMKNLNMEEIFVSHVIQKCLYDGQTFSIKEVSNYIDVGTAQDWFEYNDKPVLFVDIDGTLIKAQSRYGENSYFHDPVPIQDNIDVILSYQKNGSQLIFTTARPCEYYDETYNMLGKLGFYNFTLIMGLNNASRILINDYNTSNPFPRASAINIKRDANNLSDFLPMK